MDTSTHKAPNLLELAKMDARKIMEGTGNLPKRIGGVRTFTEAEKRILLFYYIILIKPILDKIDEAKRKRKQAAETGKRLVLKAEQLQNESTQIDIQRIQKEIEEEKSKLPSSLQTNGTDEQAKTEKKKETRQNLKKIMAFMLVGFLIEALAFIATKSFQNETLGWDVITTRLLFLLGIYLESAYLYIRYIKTRNKVVKGFVALSILASAACLLHVIAAALLNDVSETSTTVNYGLQQLAEATNSSDTSTGWGTKFLSYPGLVEFVFSSLLCFGEIILNLDITKTKNEECEDSSTKEETYYLEPDFNQLSNEQTLEHIEELERQKDIAKKIMSDQTDQNDSIIAKCEEAKSNGIDAKKIEDELLEEIVLRFLDILEVINCYGQIRKQELDYRNKGKPSPDYIVEPIYYEDVVSFNISQHESKNSQSHE